MKPSTGAAVRLQMECLSAITGADRREGHLDLASYQFGHQRRIAAIRHRDGSEAGLEAEIFHARWLGVQDR